jgi:GNAT superfamily N-acetyltransferase
MKFERLSPIYFEDFYNVFTEIITRDFPEYSEDTKQLFLQKFYSKELLKSTINLEDRFYLLCLEDSELIGFLFANKPFGGVGFISWVGVRSHKRRKGIGKALLGHYEEYCKDWNAHLVELYTFSKTQKFYELCGYEKVGYRKKGYFGVENIIMDKEI